MTIQANYLNEIGVKLQTDVSKAVINNSIEISSFSLEQFSAGTYEIKFSVLSAQTTQINNIKLKKIDNAIITDNNVDIPITEDEVIIRHLINIIEVIN